MNDRRYRIACLGGRKSRDFTVHRDGEPLAVEPGEVFREIIVQPGGSLRADPEQCAERSLGAISEEGGADRALAYKVRYLESRLDAVLRSRSWRLIALARGALGRCNVLGRLRAKRKWRRGAAAQERAIARVAPSIPCPASPVRIVVPVYNGYEYVVKLVGSLRRMLPQLDFPTSVIVVDDASTDPLLHAYYAMEDFFGWPEVRLLRLPENQGFVAAANAGLMAVGPGCDVLLCNSDIELHAQALHALRATAARHPDAASVTPLSNSATIASIFDWPRGAPLPPKDAQRVIDCVAALGLESPDYSAPTGVGFCMYVTAAALERVGLFEEGLYAQGYGEENDWCQRAVRQGFRHLICTETFVPHYETKSFQEWQKQQLIQRNHRILAQRFPSYFPDVEAYVAADPTRDHRAIIGLHLAWRRLRAPYVVFVLHNDPSCFFGGTELHVARLAQALERRGIASFCIFPPEPDGEDIAVSCLGTGERYTLRGGNAPWLRDFCSGALALHVHHLERLAPVEALLPEINTLKLLTVHDFHLLCPRSNFVSDAVRYCEKGAPGRCADRGGRCVEGGLDTGLLTRRLDCFQHILFPSQSARDVFVERGALESAPDGAGLCRRMEVLPHFLPYAPPEDAVPAPQASEVSESSGGLAVYLGFVSPHKGAKLLARYFGQRRPHGLDFEIWGHAPDWPYKDAVRPYRDWRELRSLAERYRPKLVVLPALWPETFSYTLYEALFLLRVPVLVGPYGNPARVVAEHDLGVVLRGVDMTAMDAGLGVLLRDYQRHAGAVRDFVRERGPAFAQERYAENYLRLVRGAKETAWAALRDAQAVER